MIRFLVLAVLLAACTPGDRNTRTLDPDTLVWHTTSRDAEVFRDGKDHVLARAIIMEKQGSIRYTLSLSFLRGGPNGPRIRTVTRDGKTLRYRRHDRLSAYCIDHCHKTEIGAITLPRYAFRRAANDGMTLQIDGLRRNYTANIPARVFWHALDAANLLAPTRPR